MISSSFIMSFIQITSLSCSDFYILAGVVLNMREGSATATQKRLFSLKQQQVFRLIIACVVRARQQS